MRFFFRFLKLVCRLAFKPCLKTFFGNARPVGHALNDETISVFFAIKNPINILAWDTEFLSSSSIWCHPVISSDIWFPLCKGKIHASTNNNLKYPRFFDAFFLYSVFSVWTAQMEIGGMFRRDAGQNAPLLRHKTKGKSRIMNQNQAKEYYKKLFVNYPDVLSVEEATTLLGFKSQTAIIRRIHQHRIRCLKVGRSFMIPKEYLIDYLLDS